MKEFRKHIYSLLGSYYQRLAQQEPKVDESQVQPLPPPPRFPPSLWQKDVIVVQEADLEDNPIQLAPQAASLNPMQIQHSVLVNQPVQNVANSSPSTALQRAPSFSFMLSGTGRQGFWQ